MTTVEFGPKGWAPDRIDTLEGRTFLVTGATAGTGLEATRAFLAKGAAVVMLNRNPDKSAAVLDTLRAEFGADAPVRSVRMDLAELDSVRQAAAEVLETVPRIDALICNAAIAQVAEQRRTVDGFESQLGVNHYGHFLLCGLLFARIEASGGRVVVVGSNAYKMGLKRIKFEDLDFDEGYSAWDSCAQSKLAQMVFAYELQRRVQAAGKDVQVHVCHPGASKTNLLQATASTFNKVLWSVLSRFIAQSAERGAAWPEVMCATEDGLPPASLFGPTRRSDTVGPVGACTLDPLALDAEMARQLWTVSEQKTALRFAV
jgi:NAD(P)-dependent dehydrogenase (short-subunit alcohol dehydrogenase family)